MATDTSGIVKDKDWLAVAACAIGLIFTVGTLLVYSFGVFVRPLAAEFGWTRTQLSGAVAVSQFALALSAPFWGYAVDRFGVRKCLIPSVILISLLFGSLGLLTPNLWHFYLVFAAIPIIAGAASPIGYSSTLIWRFDRKLGLAFGLALMGVGLGATILSPLAQALVDALGWRKAYGAMGVLSLIITLPAALIATRGLQNVHIRSESANATPSGLKEAALTPHFILMCVIFLLLGTATVGVLPHLVPMMVDRGVPPVDAAKVAALTGIATLVARGGLGWFLDRFHAPFLLAIISICAMASFLILGNSSGLVLGAVGAALTGLAVGAEVDFISFLTRRYFSSKFYGRLYGIAFGVYLIGAGIGPLFMGYSFDHLGGYYTGLMSFAGCAVLAALLTFRLPRYGSPGHAPAEGAIAAPAE